MRAVRKIELGKGLGVHIGLGVSRRANNWYTTCFGVSHNSPASIVAMLSAKERRVTAVSDPVPLTTSAEEIRKAEAIREALRRKFLERAEPKFIPSWVVGAD